MNSKIPLIERDSEVELHSAPVSQSTAYSVISKDTTQECFAARGRGGVGGLDDTFYGKIFGKLKTPVP